MAQQVKYFDDLIPKDVPKGRQQVSPTENPFADLIPAAEGEQTSNVGAKGNMRPGDRPITDVQGQFAKGATFNFGDEIVAGLGVPVDVVVNALSGEGPTDPKEVYQQIRAFQASQEAATQEQKPIASTTANIGGAFLPAGGGLKLVAAAPSLLGKGIRAAGGGALIGGLSGAGEGETLEERGTNAIEGAKIGAAVGLAAPGVGRAVGQGFRLLKATGRALSAPVRSLANKETFAAQKVAEAAQRDQMGPARLEGRLRAAQKIKPDAMLADVGGKNTQSLLRAAGNVPSEARENLIRGLGKRQDQQLDRVRADIGSAFGDTKTFNSTTEALALSRKQNAKPLFDAAFQTGTPWTVPLQNVLSRPLTRKLVQRAEDAAANRGEQFKAIFAQVSPDGKSVKFARVPDTEALHRVKMEIDNAISQLKRREETGLGNVQLRDLTILKKDLLGAIQNPAYKKALNQYAGDSAAVNAIDEGFENGLTMEPEAIETTLKGLSQAEADLWRLGFARKIVNQLRDTGRAGTNRAEILYSPKYLDRMRAAFKDSPTGKNFMQKLNMERRMSRTKAAAEGNSTTAQQLAEGMEAGVEAENIRQAADLGGKLARGDLIGALVSWVGRAKNLATGLRPEVADQIIRMLTSKDPATVSRAQKLVEQEIVKLQRRQGAPKRVEQGVTTLGLGSIPALASSGGP